MKLSVYIAVSLDGYIARKNGDVDWLEGHESAGEGEDMGYGAFMDSVDALVMGRNTYDKVLSFGVGWPYGEKKVFVLTKRPFSPPDDDKANVESLAGSPAEIVAQLAARGFKHLYVDGGNVIQHFLRAGLIDQFVITTIPILIGGGISLFGSIEQDLKVQHVNSQVFPNGFVQNTYAIP